MNGLRFFHRSLVSSLSHRKAQIRISADEFRARRAALVEKVVSDSRRRNKSTCVEPIIILFSRLKTFSAPDVPHVFRQCSNFRYLTGFGWPDTARLVIDGRRSTLFVHEKSEHEILWNGEALSRQKIIDVSGVDQVLPLSEFSHYLIGNVRTDSTLAIDLAGIEPEMRLDTDLRQFLPALRNVSDRVALLPAIDVLRWQKSPAEIQLMRDTCAIGAASMNATVSQAKRHTNESHLVGLLEFEARRRGAQFSAYPAVVAAGNNANTIHYISSNQVVKFLAHIQDIDPSDCVLIDAGCDVDGYVSDITRCFPITGRFSAAQLTLYDALNHVQDNLLHYVNTVRPLKLNELYMHMMQTMAASLSSIMFFKQSMNMDQMIIECDKLCPHHVSHYLGMDVHDTPSVSRDAEIPAGVVITVEPGIYVTRSNGNIREEFRGIGFRIEDDILITETESEVLTKSCVRSSADIQSVMSCY